MFYNPYGEKTFLIIQSNLPLAYLEAISPCHLGLEAEPHLATTCIQAVVGSNKVTPEPPFLQNKQPQLPQLLLI